MIQRYKRDRDRVDQTTETFRVIALFGFDLTIASCLCGFALAGMGVRNEDKGLVLSGFYLFVPLAVFCALFMAFVIIALLIFVFLYALNKLDKDEPIRAPKARISGFEY